MFSHPYELQDDRAFWSRSIAGRAPTEIQHWYEKRFDIEGRKIGTAGSCFAQHIGRHVRDRGYDYLDCEPPPSGLPPQEHSQHGYGIYSARYGNIYSSRQLLQLFLRAFGEFEPKERYWEKDGGYIDPFRPTVQPVPFESIDDLLAERDRHMAAVRTLFETVGLFVFTLGLTETWMDLDDGAVYPVVPGAAGGTFRRKRHRLVNLGYNDVLGDMNEFMNRVIAINSDVRFLLTVSPVPLIATATDQQVAVATCYSKSVLRAVAGQLFQSRPRVDYFPSFEMINGHMMLGQFYGADRRTVQKSGVEFVMQRFFEAHSDAENAETSGRVRSHLRSEDDVICDELLLDVAKEE